MLELYLVVRYIANKHYYCIRKVSLSALMGWLQLRIIIIILH